jgi:hypothetical protein
VNSPSVNHCQSASVRALNTLPWLSPSVTISALSTLLVTSRVIAWRLNLAEDASEIVDLCDLYLEPWTNYESRENLIAAFKLANRVGMVCRALTWHRLLVGVEESVKAEYGELCRAGYKSASTLRRHPAYRKVSSRGCRITVRLSERRSRRQIHCLIVYGAA